jgi:hypothetical protein
VRFKRRLVSPREILRSPPLGSASPGLERPLSLTGRNVNPTRDIHVGGVRRRHPSRRVHRPASGRPRHPRAMRPSEPGGVWRVHLYSSWIVADNGVRLPQMDRETVGDRRSSPDCANMRNPWTGVARTLVRHANSIVWDRRGQDGTIKTHAVDSIDWAVRSG